MSNNYPKQLLDKKAEYYYIKREQLRKDMKRLGGKFGGKKLDDLINSEGFLAAIEYTDGVAMHGKDFEKDFKKKNEFIMGSEGFKRGLKAISYDKAVTTREAKIKYQQEKQEQERKKKNRWEIY